MNIEFLEDILMSDTPSALIKDNEEQITVLIPELKRCKGFNQNSPWHIYDVYEHILKVVDLVPENKTVRFTALFHDVGKPEVYYADEKGIGHFFGHWERSAEIFEAFCKRQEVDADFASCVLDLIYYHDINFDKLTDEETEAILKKFDSEKLKLLFTVKRADLLAQNPEYHYLLANYEAQEKRALAKLQAMA